jgi:hypothetical protein
MRHGVLRQKRRLEANFGADPFAFGVWGIGRMITSAAAAELRAEVGGLGLLELPDLFPGRITHGAGDVNLEFQKGHGFQGSGFNVSEFQGFQMNRRIAFDIETLKL